MKCLSPLILEITFSILVFSTLFAADASADSVIRIIGDKTTKAPNNTSEATAVKTYPASVSGSNIIRIIGDKTGSANTPAGEKSARPEPKLSASPIKEIRIIGDKIETVQKRAPEQPIATEVVEKELKAKIVAEEDNLPEETAEEQLAHRLAALMAEEERKVAEKAEQERLAQDKAEKEVAEAARLATIEQEQQLLAALKEEEARKAAEKAELERLAKEKSQQEKIAAEVARQAAIKLEHEREQQVLAARRAEEVRQAAEKAELERVAALKAEEERLAAARKAVVERLSKESDVTLQPPGPSNTAAASPVVSPGGLDTSVKQEGVVDNVPGPAPESIWDLYLFAKVNDPALGRTEARVTGSRADSDLLLSGLLPHLSSSAGVKQISQALSNYAPNDLNYNYTALNYNVTASLTLLHVPTLYSLAAAAAGLSAEQAGVAAARQNLIVKFTDSYFSLLKAQADKQIAQGEINRLKQVLEQSQAFLKTGTGDIIAVYEAQSRLDGAVADLTRSESSLRLAEQKLSTVVGKPVSAIENYLPQLPKGPEPDSLDWWVATMEKEQPAVRQAREGVAQISEQKKSAKAEYLPVLQASGGYDVNRGTAALPTAEVRQWFVGATISLPLYSGGETSAKIRRAVASEEERRQAFNETLDQQRENVKQAFFNLRYNISFIRALEQKKASAEIQLAAVSKGRKIGTRNAIDVLNAEQSYSVALRDYKYAMYDNFIRVIQLKSAAGILVDADVSDVSRSIAPTLTSWLK